MEAFTIYLLKSASWLTGFALVYLLFLRNERFFMLKRVYLIAGMLVSIIFPFISVHYQVELPAPEGYGADLIPAAVPVNAPVQQFATESFDYRAILLFLYLSGTVFLIYKIVRHIIVLYKTIKKVSINNKGPAKLVRVSGFPTSFTFFNYVFIDPSLGETEVEEIMNHELVHIKQKHWFDLMMVEILRMVQWVNPFAWIYTGFIRQNHEYLADEAALRNTSNPAIYRAALVNQLFNSPVISLSNSLNYSLNKKRFDMMKKIITSPYRKLKVLLIIPVFAIVFYAFATPEYKYLTTVLNTQSKDGASITTAGEVRGIVLKEDNTPFEGVFVVVTGTNARATTDASGNFTISNVPKEASLVISQVGYKTQFIKAEFTSKMTINLMKDPDYIEPMQIRSTSPGGTGSNPLVVIDGIISDKGMKDISSADVARVTVLKDKNATDKYGEKGKDGVIEIISTKKAAELGIKVPSSKFPLENPEKKPEFPGGNAELMRAISNQTQYPAEAKKLGLQGRVVIKFVVTAEGKVIDAKVIESAVPILDSAALRTVNSLPDFIPAEQEGKTVDAYVTVPITFTIR